MTEDSSKGGGRGHWSLGSAGTYKMIQIGARMNDTFGSHQLSYSYGM